jgi:glycosyltransferase involved in cell wall biosynthesis
MNIVECHFEFSGFDDRLVKAGTSVYLWNLCRQLHRAGHQVTGLTAAHGLLASLRESHEVTTLDWHLDAEIPIRLDPGVWPGFAEQATIPVRASAHRMRIDGVDVIMLAGGILDAYRETFYPAAQLEGRDLSFLKPLVFQVVAARYLADTAAPGTVVHLHEPRYHHLLPAALRGRGLVVVSTVQTNVPVNMKVYGPEVRTLLSYLGADASVADGLADPPLDSPLERAMRRYLPATLLYRDYPERQGHDYVSVLGVVIRSANALDFLSHGQLEHALTQAGTPFEQLFERLAVREELRARSDQLVVGGCAIGPEWLDIQRDEELKKETLTRLGLDARLPTVYHNGRYSPEHKGQHDMFRGLLRLLRAGERCNILLHCLTPQRPECADLDALTSEYSDLVRLRTDPMTPDELVEWATASDLCLFASKFEMDTFLMAMGEAMACGAVPIATAQRGMRHFGHSFDLDDPAACGLALPRSFRVDDPDLVDAVHDGIRRMLHLVRTEPDRVDILRARAVATARKFTWERVASRFLTIFSACASGALPVADPAVRTALSVIAQPTVSVRGHAAARRHPGGIDVSWDLPDVTRVEVVIAAEPAEVITLEPGTDGARRARLRRPDLRELALLITLPDGRAVWDAVAVDDVWADVDA